MFVWHSVQQYSGPEISAQLDATAAAAKMSSMSELEPTKAEYWDKMSDQKACASAKMRDIGVPDMSEMDDTAKLLASSRR